MKTVPVFLLLFATIARTEPTIRDEVDDYIDCKPSPTTVSGSAAPSGVLCKNQLIFEENFNTFDTNIWHHEQQIFGADVSARGFGKSIITIFNKSLSYRKPNSNGTQIAAEIHLYQTVGFTSSRP